MNYNHIVIFGKNGYYVGTDYIEYQSINDINCYKEVNTINGIMYCCILKNEFGFVGCDKLLPEEYIYLINRIKRNSE